MENFINIVFDQKQEVDDIVVSEVATSASNALLEYSSIFCCVSINAL